MEKLKRKLAEAEESPYRFWKKFSTSHILKLLEMPRYSSLSIPLKLYGNETPKRVSLPRRRYCM